VLGPQPDHAEAEAPALRLAQLDDGDGSALRRVLYDLLEGLVIEIPEGEEVGK
jgi:hypothetical protein